MDELRAAHLASYRRWAVRPSFFPLETNIVIKLRSAVRNWYEGKYLPYENDPRSILVFIGGDHKRHWTARVVRVLVEFWHWSSLSAWLRSS